MSKTKVAQEAPTEAATPGLDVLAEAIARATTQAIQAAKPVEKKTILTYKGRNPWDPPEGTPKLKLKRKMFVHSLAVDPDMVSNDEIAMLNKVRPGRYCDGFITVERRRDKGINISWPIKTASQRMRLSAQYGIRSLVDLLQCCVSEDRTPIPDDADE